MKLQPRESPVCVLAFASLRLSIGLQTPPAKQNEWYKAFKICSYKVGSKECYLPSMKELFLTAIMQPPEVLLSTFVCLCVCFFFMFPCSNVHLVRAYLLTYYSNDLRYRLNQLNCMTQMKQWVEIDWEKVHGNKVHIFWEGNKILRNIHQSFVLHSCA